MLVMTKDGLGILRVVIVFKRLALYHSRIVASETIAQDHRKQ
jgi:hypothetical protein